MLPELRQGRQFRGRHRATSPQPAWLLASCALGACVAASPALATDPYLKLAAPLTQLRAGQEVRVALKVHDLSACRLELRVGSRVVGSALASADGVEQLIWRWRVPAITGSAVWAGFVECWEGDTAVPTGSSRHQQSFTGTLTGQPSSPVALVNGDRLLVAAEPRSPPRPLKTTMEKLASAAQIFGILGLVLVWRTLVAGRREARSERTSRIMERYFGRDLEQFANVLGFLAATTEETCLRRIRRWETTRTGDSNLLTDAVPKANPVSRNDVLQTIYFFEEIAVLFNSKELDRRTIVRTFGVTVPQALEACWWWIQYERAGNRPAAHPRAQGDGEIEYYTEWERTVMTLVRMEPSLETTKLNRAGRDDQVRALCLPAQRGSTDNDGWWDCEDLSCAIGDALRAPDTRDDRMAQLEQALVPTDEERQNHAAEPAKPRTFLIMPWRDHVLEPSWPVRRAKLALAAWVLTSVPWERLRRGEAGQPSRIVDALRARVRKCLDAAAAKSPRITRYRRVQNLALIVEISRAVHGDRATVRRIADALAPEADDGTEAADAPASTS